MTQSATLSIGSTIVKATHIQHMLKHTGDAQTSRLGKLKQDRQIEAEKVRNAEGECN